MDHTQHFADRLAGRWIFLVEDVFPILLTLEGIVHSFDCHVLRAQTLDEAAPQARASNIDAAILDINLQGQTAYPVAAILRGRDIPMAFATAYGVDAVPSEWRQYPIISKPYQIADVRQALAMAMDLPPSIH